MRQLRLSIVGFGVVGQGLVELLARKRMLLRQQFGFDVLVVGIATARSGFVYRAEGLDLPLLLQFAAQHQPLTLHPGIQHWEHTLDGLRATEADVLAEVTGTNLRDAEPGMSHIRTALAQHMHVITANKGPVALAAPELLRLAQLHSVQLRLESTVMAGTPVLSTIRDGMAGAQIHALQGILNGTTNYMLSAMTEGVAYDEVLAEAQAAGYAEADPTADVEGFDVVAKTLILASVAFGQPLTPQQVHRTGITAISQEQIQQAKREGKRIKLLATLRTSSEVGNSPLEARVEPVALPLAHPLARVDGTMNAITLQTDTLSEVTVIGPGAGRVQTAQGLLADLIAVAQ